MMSHRIFPAAALLACLLAGADAGADATLVYAEGGRTNQLRIADGRARFDNAADGTWMLFEAGRRELTLVDPGRREYIRIDEATLASMRQTLDILADQVEAQLANLPPSMRDQARQMMGGVMPGADGARDVRVEATGRSGAAAGHACAYSRVRVDGEVQSEVCLARADSLGLGAEDVATVSTWQGFALSMAEQASRYVKIDAGILGAGGELPLIYSNPQNGAKAVLTRLSDDAVEAALLQVPQGFKETKLAIPGM